MYLPNELKSTAYATAVNNNYYILNEFALKKIGNIVIGRLNISTTTSSNDSVKIGTLPSGYAPSSEIGFDFCQLATSSSYNLRYYLKTDGSIYARWGSSGMQSYIPVVYLIS